MATLVIDPPARRTLLHAAALTGCAALLWFQLRDVEIASLFARVDPWWLVGAVAVFAVSLAAAAHNISAFAPLRVRALDSLRAQLAIGGLRIIAPAALSTPVIGTRFLMRSGLAGTTAATVLAVAQTAQLVMTIVVVAGIALLASADLSMPGATAGWVALGLAIVLVVAAIVAHRSPRVRAALARTIESVRLVASHLRAHPTRVVSGLGASGLLTIAHVGAFACCVTAVGGHASLLALTAVYLAASGAGSLVPTPGGVGAVESALISGLIASGLTPQTATAAALLSRLVSVWLPAVPGLVALRGLRRDGLL